MSAQAAPELNLGGREASSPAPLPSRRTLPTRAGSDIVSGSAGLGWRFI
jgi:hypothetical protein